MTFALVTALALSANPTVVDLFKDKGQTFIKAGTKQGLQVGSDVTVLGDPIGDTGEYRSAGTATVMEVWDTVSRVVLDDEAKKHPEAKHVKVGSGGRAKAAAAKAEPRAAEAKASGEPAAAGLKGSASIIGFGPARRITVNNSGSIDWTNCELRLPTNQRYKLAGLKAGDREAVVLPKFQQDGMEHDKPLDRLFVKCDQGSASFSM